MNKKIAVIAGALSGIGETVSKAVQALRRQLRYTVGGLAARLRLLRISAPAGLMDAGTRKDSQLA